MGKNRCLINPFPLLLLMLMGQTITILGVFPSLFRKLLDLKRTTRIVNSFNLEAKVAAKWKIHSVFLNNVILT